MGFDYIILFTFVYILNVSIMKTKKEKEYNRLLWKLIFNLWDEISSSSVTKYSKLSLEKYHRLGYRGSRLREFNNLDVY